MIMRKHLLLVIATCVLTMFLITIVPIRSQNTAGQYDPWLDINDDGKIDGRDIAPVARAFGAFGDPINKTELLIDVNNTYTELFNRINSCNTSLIDLSDRVAYLEANLATNDSMTFLSSRIDSLNATLLDVQNQVTSLLAMNATLFGVQSNVTALQGRTDILNATFLGVQNNFTLLQGRVTTLETSMSQLQSNVTVLQANISDLNATVILLSSEVATLQTNYAAMNETLVQMNSTINNLNTTLANQINNLQAEITVLNATKLGKPDYETDWFTVSPGGYKILTHNLGTYHVLVYMFGWNGYVNQIQYGGDDTSYMQWGAYWSDLTTTTIRITRQANDVNWQMIEVFIWIVP